VGVHRLALLVAHGLLRVLHYLPDLPHSLLAEAGHSAGSALACAQRFASHRGCSFRGEATDTQCVVE
jgi:hypothetical protein